MPSRTDPAASITVTASLASSMAAFAATTNPEALSFQSVGASTTAPSATARSAVAAPGASAVADLGPATTPSTGAAAVRSAAAIWVVALTGAGSSGPGASGVARPSRTTPPVPRPTPDSSSGPTSTTTESPGPATTTPTKGSALFNCAGSDDRLSEAVRHTREASCHGQGRDD